MSIRKALLVGLCQVSPAAYGGWDGVNGCEGCELDVENVEKILTPLGYTIQRLTTAAATKAAILTALEEAAEVLLSGDRLVFYYAGHGGQQPDPDKDEDDGHDETLLAYDGEITDDELNTIWLKFQRGVRILMLSDSCNSGTNYRGIRSVFTPTPIQPLSANTRAIMLAELIHMGGCRDGFTSSGYKEGGAFTIALTNAWNGGAFVGTYRNLYDAIVATVDSGQAPQYNEYGMVSDSFRNERAFVGEPLPTPSVGEPRPTLPPIPEPPPDNNLSDDNQRLLIEAYLKLLETLNVTPAPRTRTAVNSHLVCVHGINTHVAGYSDAWWKALKEHTSRFGESILNKTRHEVLWSNLVNSRSIGATADDEAQAAELLRLRIEDVLEDRHRQQAAPVGRSAVTRGAGGRGLETTRGGDFSLDDFLVYMINQRVRQQIIDRFTSVVAPLLATGAELHIIAHSWGTVVAYEGLRELEATVGLAGRVANLFTVGSALSIPPVRGSLRTANRDGQRPALVDRWINIDAQGDLVGGTLADRFAVDVEKLELEPTGCQRSLNGLGWYNLACAHASYFRPANLTVNRQIFGQYINT
ncbi:MAG: caspase family protein [Caldilineaceae bacterium]|nr:caspase family protein [Caldilineaceae bacterium]